MAQGIEVATSIRNVTSLKSDDKANNSTPVVFSFNVNMEEIDRNSDSVKLNFQMMMDTDPAIAKFTVDGTATVSGDLLEVEKVLSADPQTNVPEVFTRIYQQVYSVIFMLAGTIDVPYPSPALLKKVQVRNAFPNRIQA
ncbi:MAG: hypothetical protein ACYCQJ_00745 [Nitrososphaerales archaeon]